MNRRWLNGLLRAVLLAGGPALLACVALPAAPCGENASAAGAAAFAGAVAIIVAWAILLGRHRRADQRWARQNPLLAWGVLIVASAGITVSLVGENLQAGWRVLDDHEYIAMLGPTGELTPSRFVREVRHSPEIMSPGTHATRYRPVFHLMRFTQMLAFGSDPAGYWGVRVAQFFLAILLSWWAMAIWLGGVEACLVLAWLLGLGFWRDVWCRMGSAGESLGATGIAMMAAAAAGLWLEVRRGRRLRPPRRVLREWGWWLLMAGGTLLALGSKESFLPLLPVLWLFMLWVGWRHGLGWAGRVCGLAASLAGLWILAVLLVAVAGSGRDYYQNPVSLGSRLGVLTAWALGWPGLGWTIVGAGALVAAGGLWGVVTRRGTPWRRRVARLMPTAAMLLLIFAGTVLAQVVVYNGKLPTSSRYDFPGLIAAMLLLVAGVDLALRVLRAAGPERWPGRLADAARASALTALCLIVLIQGLGSLKQGSRWNVEESLAFAKQIDRIYERVSKQPDRALLFVAYRPDNIELVISVQRFLRARGVTNPAYVITHFDPAKVVDPLDKSLAATLEGYSRAGGEGFRSMNEYRIGRWPFGLFFDFNGVNDFPEPIEGVLQMSSRGSIGRG